MNVLSDENTSKTYRFLGEFAPQTHFCLPFVPTECEHSFGTNSAQKVFYAIYRLSEEERRVDALALRADERRDKLRKASGRSKYPLIRRYLNGETRLSKPQSSIRQSITYGREPGELKHLSSRRKRKKTRFPE